MAIPHDVGQFLTAGLGFITTVITAISLGYIAVEYNFAVYTWTLFFVIPFGAIGAGMAAASGYYFGAMWVHTKPSGGILFNMMLASISAFFIINYTIYLMLEYEGIPLSDVVGFWEYVDFDIRTTSLVTGRTSRVITDELGSSGYLYAGLQLLGFMGGGTWLYFILKDLPFCEACSRYRKRVLRQDRYTGDGEEVVRKIEELVILDDAGVHDGAINHHATEMGSKKQSKKEYIRTRYEVFSCTSCGTALLNFTTSKGRGSNWEDIPDLGYLIHADETPQSASKN